MNKFNKIIFCIACCFLLITNIKAACSDTSLNDFVEKLEIKFLEPRTEEDYAPGFLKSLKENESPGYYYYFYFSEDKYNGKDINETLELIALDGEGKPGIWKYQPAIAKYGVGGYNGVDEETYTLKVKAISGACKDQILKQTSYTIPKFNMYVNTAYCEKYPDHELCQTFTDKTEDMNDADFGKAMAEYERSLKDKKPTFKKFILKYYSYILCIVIPIILVSIYYRRRIKRLIKMKNQIEDGDRRIKRHKRKAEVFIIFLVLFAFCNVKAASGCDIQVVRTRYVASITGTQVSVSHCSWGSEGTFTSPDFDSLTGSVGWGEELVPYGGDPCSGTGGGMIRRCVLKKGIQASGGQGKIEVEPHSRSITCKDNAVHGVCSLTHNCDCNNAYTDENGVDHPDTHNCGCNDGGQCPDGTCKRPGSPCSKNYSLSMGGGTFDTYSGAAKDKAEACKQMMQQLKDACTGWRSYTLHACKTGSSKVRCPTYPCRKTSTTVTPTIETHEIEGESSYCVNPSYPASSTGYKEINLDASKCANSNSSVDCGYANILIESKYHNEVTRKSDPSQGVITDEMVALAMRLWGAYTNQGGYGTVGLGVYTGEQCTVDLNGDLGGTDAAPFQKCYEMTYLNPNTGKQDKGYLNVYKKTVEYMLTPSNVTSVDLDKYDALKSVEVKDARGIFNTLQCVANSGIICGENMRYVLALFYNTKNGNEHFKEHLNKLFGEVSVLPVNISISSQTNVIGTDVQEGEEIIEEDCIKDSNGECVTTKTILNIEYGEEITKGTERIDCAPLLLKQKNNPGSLTEKERMVLNYCKFEVEEIRVYYNDGSFRKYVNYVNGEGKDRDYYQDCKMVDNVESCGPKVTTPGTISGISACQKSLCAMSTKIYADCTEDIKNITVVTTYNESTTSYGIKKYVSCDAANPMINDGITNQFLYKIEPFEKTNNVPKKKTKQYYEIELNCDADCEDTSIKRSSQACGEPKVSDVKNYTKTGTYETSINDPSLSCILNASVANKATYDYSDYFGVNTDVCRIYCSDSAHYYLADKTVIYNGLSFRFDIEKSAIKKNSSVKSLDSIIEMRRDCVSEIYYDRVTSSKKFGQIAATYGFDETDIEALSAVDTWKELYNAIYNRVRSRENNRNELLTKLIYDLYNCNLYSEIPIAQPKDNTVGPIFENSIKKKYTASNNYGFEDCTLNSNTNNCISYEGITYDGGAQYAPGSGGAKAGLKDVGDARDTILFAHTLELNPNTASISKVKYCKGKGCFDYNKYVISKNYNINGNNAAKVDENLKHGEYLLPDQRINPSHENAYRVSNSPDENGKKYIQYADSAQHLESVNYINNNKSLTSKDVPINDYAYFTISTKVGYYNKSTFQAKAYTGDVYDTTYGSNYNDVALPTRVNVPSGTYPATVIPKECPIVNGSKTGTNYYQCSFKSYMGETGTYHRNFDDSDVEGKPKLLDKFYTAINNDDATTFSCWYINKYAYDNDPQAIYRNVELNDIFPSNRIIGKNWSTAEANEYINATENYVNQQGILQYYNKHLEYSYTLDQDALKKIREDNSNNKKYTNDNLYAGSVDENKYTELRSLFLDAQSLQNYGIIDNRSNASRGESEYTYELKTSKKGGN